MKNKYKILFGVMVLVFLIQVCVGIVTKQIPAHDYGKIFNGAVVYALEGNSTFFKELYIAYFHRFTNNVPPFLLLSIFFNVLHSVGVTSFYGATVMMGHLLFAGTMMFTFLYLDKAFGLEAAMASLLLWLAFLPIYFQSSVMYTDTMSIWAAPLVLYLHQCAKEVEAWQKKLCYYFLMGMTWGIGVQIKATVLFVGLAVLLELVLYRKWKDFLAAGLTMIICISVISFGFSAWNKATIYEPSREQEEMPFTFWIMMGLTGDGSYNSYDEWTITGGASTTEERMAIQVAVIEERLKEMGPVKYGAFLVRKANRTFGCATADLENMLMFEPENPDHWIYEIISSGGAWYRIFNNFSQGVYNSFYLFAVAGVVIVLLQKNKEKRQQYLNNVAPFLALLGFFAFMLLWEANHRQLVNQWPFFIIVAAAGISTVLMQINKRNMKNERTAYDAEKKISTP